MGDPTLVVVSGDQDNCDDCIDHLKLLEEEYIQDAAEADWERDYLKPTREVDNKESNKKRTVSWFRRRPGMYPVQRPSLRLVVVEVEAPLLPWLGDLRTAVVKEIESIFLL